MIKYRVARFYLQRHLNELSRILETLDIKCIWRKKHFRINFSQKNNHQLCLVSRSTVSLANRIEGIHTLSKAARSRPRPVLKLDLDIKNPLYTGRSIIRVYPPRRSRGAAPHRGKVSSNREMLHHLTGSLITSTTRWRWLVCTVESLSLSLSLSL